jgi:hypothetical protein
MLSFAVINKLSLCNATNFENYCRCKNHGFVFWDNMRKTKLKMKITITKKMKKKIISPGLISFRSAANIFQIWSRRV